MNTVLADIAAKVTSREPLTDDEARTIAATPDIISVGILADEIRRARHGDRVTFVRVLDVPVAEIGSTKLQLRPVPPSAGEVRLTGKPTSLEIALASVRQMSALKKGPIPLSGFTLADLESMAATERVPLGQVLNQLHDAGLELVAEAPLDRLPHAERSIEVVYQAGLAVARLTVEQTDTDADGIALARKAAATQRRVGALKAFAPLARSWNVVLPSTGYADVKRISLARLLIDNIESIQVDWARYGPKLAQVALTFGANDVDAVSTDDAGEQGRRRAPLEEIRRNIQAAALRPVERNGRFDILPE